MNRHQGVFILELDDSTVYEELRAYIARELLDGQDDGLDRTTRLLEWGIIDSMSMVALLEFIRERFGVAIPDDDVIPAHFSNLDVLTRCILRLHALQQASGEPRTGTPNYHYALIRALEPYGVVSERLEGEGTSVHHLRTVGREPAWVLLPALGNPASSWGIVLRGLAGEQEAIALDFAGFGLTTGPVAAPTFDDQLALTLDAMERLTRGRVVLVGHSAGAMVAIDIARRFPHKVAALVVTSFGAIAEPRAWWSSLQELSRDPSTFLQRAYYGAPTLGRALRGLLSSALESTAYQSFLDERALDRMPSIFEGLTVPTLFVAGEQDRIIPASAVNAAVAAVPHARIEWLARCGHFPQAERPQELFTLMQLFVASLSEGT
ncbi:alpha/beta fold hydrolase [Pendulispora brunnea]|uniref:Alpha/beta fold hydrolase n=1 Tax=Pendulispora brunnea TaxID=2905690 RepID=A0ABZ2KB32_9BACT